MKEQEEQSITFQEGAVYLNLVRSKTTKLKQKGMSPYDLLNHLLEQTKGSLLPSAKLEQENMLRP